jgi:hypothetical protein
MSAKSELQPLLGLQTELQRLRLTLAQLETRLAGSLHPEAAELLRRLNGAAGCLSTAQHHLAGTSDEREEVHLRGSTRAVPIQDLLCFLATAKKSGVLRIEAPKERFLLQLQQGAVVYSAGDTPPPGEGLSDLLAARGVLSAELLGRLPEPQSGTLCDKNLLGTSWISRDSLSSAIQEQTRLSFFRLCSAGDAHFRFYEGAEIQNVLPVRQNAMELLLEYSRALDERTQGVPSSVTPLQARARGAFP